jgi:hypothetical protein
MFENPKVQLAAEHLQAMGFALPTARTNAAMDVLRYHHAVVTFSWDDFARDPALTETELAAAFGEFSCCTVLALASLVSRLLFERGGRRSPEGIQRALVRWLLPGPVALQAERRLGGTGSFRRDAVFHHEQLLAVASLALLRGGDGDPGPLSAADRHRLGLLLLHINHHLSTGPGLAPDSDEILGHTARALRLGEAEALPDLAARYFELFGERALTAHAEGTLTYDLAADFVNAYSIDPITFMGLGVLVLVPWVGAADLGTAAASLVDIGRAVAKRVDTLGLRPATDALLSADRAWFQERLSLGPLSTADYLPLYERPFLRLADGGLLPMNWRLIMERAYGGVYWALHGLYRNRGGAQGVQDWVGQLGRSVYEPYVHDRLRGVYSRRDPAQVKYLIEGEVPPYRRHGRVVSGADGYLREGRALVVLELTASAPPAAVLMGGDGARVTAALDRLLFGRKGKFTQLDRVIGDLLTNRLSLPGVDLAAIDVIIPLLITASELPQFPTIWYRVRRSWEAAGLFAFGDRVGAPQLMNFEELEALEAALESGEVSLPELLMDRQRHYEGGSLKNYLISSGRDALLRRSTRSEQVWDRYRQAIGERLVAVGLPAE